MLGDHVRDQLKQGAGSLVGLVLGAGLVTVVSAHPGTPATGVIHSCINNSSGTIKIVSPDGACLNNEIAVDWNAQGLQGPPGAQGAAGATNVRYRSAQATGVARAFCQSGEKLTGGGGFIEDPSGSGAIEKKLRQTYPISDPSGTIAFDTTAIGWQAASSDFSGNVIAFAICATP